MSNKAGPSLVAETKYNNNNNSNNNNNNNNKNNNYSPLNKIKKETYLTKALSDLNSCIEVAVDPKHLTDWYKL